MTLIRKLWRLLDRRAERALAPEFVAHELRTHRNRRLPIEHPAGHFFLPPPRP